MTNSHNVSACECQPEFEQFNKFFVLQRQCLHAIKTGLAT
jgi:hypothetical protein